VRGVRLASGELIEADLVVVGIGVEPNANYQSRFARGRVRLESVQNAVDQARSVADARTGRPAPYQAVPWFWSHQAGHKLQIAGLSAGHDTVNIKQLARAQLPG
jgi:3-phenylpropionate/trans-cinnamate dioxygenase ferredoxin reductase component